MKIEWKDCLKVGISVFLLYLCVRYWEYAANLTMVLVRALMPMLLGCVIAYLVNILMSGYEKRYFPKSRNPYIQRSRRPVCLFLSYATLVAVVALIVCLVVPQLWSCVQLITAKFPGFMEDMIALADTWELLPADITSSLAGVDWQSRIGELLQTLTSGIGNVMDMVVSTVSSVISWVVTAVMSVIFSFYLLMSKEKLLHSLRLVCYRYLKPAWLDKAYYALSVVDECFRKFIVGQCTEAVILGLLCAVGMVILGLPYATMIGALIGFTALIPVAGAYIGAGIGAFMILTESPIKAIVFLVFIVVLQQLEGNLIYPKVVGSSVGLPGIWVLTAVTVGGGVWGIPGMLLGVPLAAAIYRILREDVRKQPAPA